MAKASNPIDDATRRKVQEIVLLVRRMSIVLDDTLDRRGLSAVRSNRVIQVLTQLRLDGPSRPRDLVGASGLTTGGMTKLLDRMVVQGLIERTDRGEHGDGRSVRVVLTPAGRRTLKRVHGVVADVHDECRPFAKEVEQLAEAIGGRLVGVPGRADLIGSLARLGTVMRSALGDGDGQAPTDDYLAGLVLCHIDLHDDTRPGAIVDVVGLSSGGVTKLLDRLESQGMVVREHGSVAGDRRAVVIRSTAKGRRFLAASTASLAQHVDEIRSVMHSLAQAQTTDGTVSR